MSTSRDNLPAVATTHDRLERVEATVEKAEKKTQTVMEQIAAIPGRILRPGAYVSLILLGAGVGGGIVGKGWAEDRMDDRAEAKVAPVRADVVEVKADVKALKEAALKAEREAAAVKMLALETNLNVRLVVERLNMKPITLPAVVEPKDAGP